MFALINLRKRACNSIYLATTNRAQRERTVNVLEDAKTLG